LLGSDDPLSGEMARKHTDTSGPPPAKGALPKDAREARLAEALRINLRRRKTADRRQQTGAEKPSED
jgi:hypothetical protein